MFLDRAPSFFADGFVGGERSVADLDEASMAGVSSDPLQVGFFPPRRSELDPVEQC